MFGSCLRYINNMYFIVFVNPNTTRIINMLKITNSNTIQLVIE